jgi:hypothetical protein
MRKRLRIVYSTKQEQVAASRVEDRVRTGHIRTLPSTEDIIRPPIEVLMEREFRYLLDECTPVGCPAFGYASKYYLRALRQQRAFSMRVRKVK